MYTFSFQAKCFWSIIRSLSILGATKLEMDITHRKTNTPMETIEMHAPETVPSLYQLGTAWQKSIDLSPFFKLENIEYQLQDHTQEIARLIISFYMLKQKKNMMNSFFGKHHYILTENEKSKCQEKFQSYKALGSTMLSKNQLKKVLREMGKEISEEDLLQMIYQADPNGHGFISYQAFQNMIASFKLQKQQNVINPIGLTFDQILRCYQMECNSNSHQIPWAYIELYLQQNFGLKVNLLNFKYFNNSKNKLNSDDFKFIFS